MAEAEPKGDTNGDSITPYLTEYDQYYNIIRADAEDRRISGSETAVLQHDRVPSFTIATSTVNTTQIAYRPASRSAHERSQCEQRTALRGCCKTNPRHLSAFGGGFFVDDVELSGQCMLLLFPAIIGLVGVGTCANSETLRRPSSPITPTPNRFF